jgi:hypothetical protein
VGLFQFEVILLNVEYLLTCNHVSLIQGAFFIPQFAGGNVCGVRLKDTLFASLSERRQNENLTAPEPCRCWPFVEDMILE